MVSNNVCSIIERKPRAPDLRFKACVATSFNASSLKSSSTSSNEKVVIDRNVVSDKTKPLYVHKKQKKQAS
jgi:hypothetical protein